MSAYIMVVDTPYFTVADAKGHFSIADIPRGEYTLRVWQESGETDSQKITIDGDKELDVTIRRR